MITVGLLIRVSSICFVLGKSEQHDNQLPKIVNEKHPAKATPGVFMGKEKALDFLQAPHRQKRWDSNLGEECHSEKCTYEEILEYFGESHSYAKEYIREHNCNKLSCKYGCRAIGWDYSKLNTLWVKCRPPPKPPCIDQNCTRSFGKYPNIYRNGSIEAKKSIGKCTFTRNSRKFSNISCVNCSNGSYADGISCKICPPIDRCIYRRCTTGHGDNQCEFCEGSVKDKTHWEAYVLWNNKKTCLKACSWRSDSTRCFPGNCRNRLASKCTCERGFEGKQCDKITEDVKISYAEAILEDKNNAILNSADDASEPDFQSVRWSNNKGWKFLTLNFTLNIFKFEASKMKWKPDSSGEKHFVTTFKYGIIKAFLEIHHRPSVLFWSGHSKVLPCFDNLDQPTFSIQNCIHGKKVDVENWNFRHNDTLTITCTASSGGYIKYLNREEKIYENPKKSSLVGKTISRSFIFRFDFIKPYQECMKAGCSQLPVDCTDLSTQVCRGNG